MPFLQGMMGLSRGEVNTMVIGGIGGLFALKRRPKAYKARDAAYGVGGNRGFYLASMPRPYPITRQQARVRDVARQCGIVKGMGKNNLMRAMVDCVGPAMSGTGRRSAA